MERLDIVLSEKQKEYIKAHVQELEELVLRLARIPAPTGKEEKRAAFCLKWLQENGAKEAYIDEVGNVVYAYRGAGEKKNILIADNAEKAVNVRMTNDAVCDSVIVYMAHMDIVFPDETELPLTEQDGRIYCPGVGDDTANLAVLLMAAKYVAQYRPDTNGRTLLFVCDVGEEGLGNLKGVREICRRFHCEESDLRVQLTKEEADFEPKPIRKEKGFRKPIFQGVEGATDVLMSRIERFYAFDLGYDCYTCHAVGSLRYRIQVRTKGGHSYGDFGNTNAIAVLAELIQKLYAVKVPCRGKTTYNVGTISGGTSVNTIAQQAEMLYEIRSDHAEDLAEMRLKFEQILNECRKRYSDVEDRRSDSELRMYEKTEKQECFDQDQEKNRQARALNQNAEILVEEIGERPCESGVDEEKRQKLFQQVEMVVEAVTGKKPQPVPCSTDCNIPLSMGIPSVCVGTCLLSGAHTREEYIEKNSLRAGLEIGLALVLGSWKF